MMKIPTEVYSRIVGYFRPISQWNAGKREEFRERKTYKLCEKQFRKNKGKKSKNKET